jgi:hypothetical protein
LKVSRQAAEREREREREKEKVRKRKKLQARKRRPGRLDVSFPRGEPGSKKKRESGESEVGCK